MTDEDCARYLDRLDAAAKRTCSVDWHQCGAAIATILTMLDDAGCGASAVARHLEEAAAAVAYEARPLAA